MASLLDNVRANLANTSASQSGQPAGGIQDTTRQIQQLSQAKTGKAVGGGSAPAATNLQEQVASGQAALAQHELQDQGKIQAEAIGQQERGQTQQFGLQQKELTEQEASILDNYNNQALQITNNLIRSDKELDQRKKAAMTEQVGFMARLGNDQYINQLQMQGQRDRLNNDTAFQEQLIGAVLSDQRDLMQNDLNFQSAMAGTDRQFADYIASMDINHAMEISQASASAANQQAQWGAIGSAASATATQYDKNTDKAEQNALFSSMIAKGPGKTLPASQTSQQNTASTDDTSASSIPQPISGVS